MRSIHIIGCDTDDSIRLTNIKLSNVLLLTVFVLQVSDRVLDNFWRAMREE